MAKSPRKHVQLELVRARRPPKTHGGWRPGAGRKRKPGAVSHGPRAPLASRFPQHVTLRIVDGVPSLGREFVMKIIRAAIAAAHKPTFRITEFNVLSNHLHLITEAGSADALARGIQGLEVRLARRLNRLLRRRGKLFAQRYHARYLRTPKEVRNALRYVLLNRKHHAADRKFSKAWIDPCSSAAWFAGWAAPIRAEMHWKQALVAQAPPTAKAKTWLLTTGWHEKHGRLRFDESPA